MFNGTLKETPLPDLLSLLAHSAKTGVVQIYDPNNNKQLASLYLTAGFLTHATAQGSLGLDGLRKACQHTQASFAFGEHVTSTVQTLVDYPADKLLNAIKAQIAETTSAREGVVTLNDMPKYTPPTETKSIPTISSNINDLAILMYCNGQRPVQEIAKLSGRNIEEVCLILSRFRKAGALELHQRGMIGPKAAPQTIQPDTNGDGPHNTTPTAITSTIRYWRGKQIQ